MKSLGKKTALMGMLLTGLGMLGTANALVLTDYAGSAGRLVSTNNPYSYTHNILDNGYTPYSPISSAFLSIWLADDAPFGDGNGFGQDGQEVAGFNIGIGGTSFGSGAVGTLGQYDFSVSSLLSNGQLNVTIRAISGDFLFGASRLLVNVGSGSVGPTPVPEPATLTMFGLGLLAMGLVVRRRHSARAAR